MQVRAAPDTPAPTRQRCRWPLSYYLAAVGAVFLFFEAWTVISWLRAGPHSITQFQDPNSNNWTEARVYEVLAVLFAVGMFIHIVRSCVRKRTVTFDAIFCVATGLLYWVDPFANWLQPIFFYSSNWVNLNAWCGNAPFVQNPRCGLLPEPVLFLGCLYTFGFLGFVMWLNWCMRKARDRWPTISPLQLIAVTFVGGMFIDILLEGPIILFRLWTYPGWPLSFTGTGDNLHRFPFFELVIASILWTGLASVRFFKDDRGRTIVERGLDQVSPRLARIVTFLGIFGAASLFAFISNSILVLHGPFMNNYPNMPNWERNDMCNSGTYTTSEYGPCPGTPGYRIPVKKTFRN